MVTSFGDLGVEGRAVKPIAARIGIDGAGDWLDRPWGRAAARPQVY